MFCILLNRPAKMTINLVCVIFSLLLLIDQLLLCNSCSIDLNIGNGYVYDSVNENHDSNERDCPSDASIFLVACDSFSLNTSNFRRCKRTVQAGRNSEVSIYIQHKSMEISFASYFIYNEKCASENCHEYNLLTDHNQECHITHRLHRSSKLDIQLLQLQLGLVIFWNDTSNKNCFQRSELSRYQSCNVTKYDSILEPTYEFKENYDEIEEPIIVSEYYMSCPVQCFCGLGYREYYTTCSNRKEITLLIYNSYVEGLEFKENDISYVKQGAFRDFYSLLYLSFTSNGIDELLPGTFSGLHSLKYLYLNRNKLRAIPSVIFLDLSSLVVLDLFVNNLKTLPNETFVGCSKLKELRLESNYKLSNLPSGLFEGLINLLELNLARGDLKTLPNGIFDSLINLKLLHLEFNDLYFPAESGVNIFRRLTRLKILNLEWNGLSTLDPNIFISMRNLELLLLSNNHITNFPTSVCRDLESLTVLKFKENRISILTNGSFMA